MLEVTHQRIAKEIAKVFGLGERETGLLETGSIHPKERICLSHVADKEVEIEIVENLFAARKLYLENDDECFYRLGIALHCIADAWTLSVGDREKQNAWNEKIEECPILDDYQLQEAIKSVTMPSKDVELYLSLLPILKSLVRYNMFKIDKNKYKGMSLEEVAAQEIINLRNYDVIKRDEIVIDSNSLLSVRGLFEYGDLDRLRMEALRLTGPFALFPLNIVVFVANVPKDKTKVLIWCALTKKTVGDWLIRRIRNIMREVTADRGIIISGGLFAPEAMTVAKAIGVDLFITASDFCMNIDPIPIRISNWSAPVIDLNFAYRISLEVARLILS